MVKWGILGCGRIARKFAADLRHVADAELSALGSRSAENVNDFAREFPARHLHTSYEELVKDPDVDVIYIATPHNLHYENTLLCLNHGKAVLCEKAFAVNLKQAREMVELARKNKVFLMEALWTKFLPHYHKMMEIVKSGQLGQIKSMLVNFGFAPTPPIPKRLFDPALAGGTVLDIGIYNVFMAISVLGIPDEIEASMTPTPTGVDEQCAILFKYKNGAMAQLFSTFSSNLATEADINGDKGRLKLTSRFYEPGTTLEYYPERMDSLQIIPVHKETGFGYQFEARHVGECLKKGLLESPVMTHEDTLSLMWALDEVRMKAGIRYAVDSE